MTEHLPDEAYAIALALLPDIGPARLRDMMQRGPGPRCVGEAGEPNPRSPYRGGEGVAATLRPRHHRPAARKLLVSGAAQGDSRSPGRIVLSRRSESTEWKTDGSSGRHVGSDQVRDRRGSAARGGAFRCRGECCLRAGPRHRWCGSRRCLRSRSTADRRRCGRSRRRVPASSHPPLGARGGARGDRLRITGGGEDREVAIPGPQSSSRSVERRGRRGREPARRWVQAHRQRRDWPRDRAGCSARLHTQCDVRRTQCDVVRRRVSCP